MGVRGSVGPILTTGVALAAAAVVVANPVMAPRADIRIPAIDLSAGSGDALAMLDEEFLRAIAPAPPQPTGPVAVLKDLFSSLAADASHLGKNAVVSALIAGASVVADPELTAVSTPYFPAPAVPVEPARLNPIAVSPGYLPPAVLPMPDGDLAELATTVARAVTTIINDVSYGVGAQVITMALAAGAFLAEETGHVVDTLGSLVRGDLDGALKGAAAGITAVATASVAIVDAVRTFVEKGFPVPPIVLTPNRAGAGELLASPLPVAAADAVQGSRRPETGQERSAQLPPTVDVATEGSAGDRPAAKIVEGTAGADTAGAAASGAGLPTAGMPSIDTPSAEIPGADLPDGVNLPDGDLEGANPGGGIKLGDGNKVSPSGRPGRPAATRDQAPGPLRAALDAARGAARDALKGTDRTGD